MRISNSYRTVARWTTDHAARRRLWLASLPRYDEQLTRIALQARAAGVPDDTWRRIFHWPNSGW